MRPMGEFLIVMTGNGRIVSGDAMRVTLESASEQAFTLQIYLPAWLDVGVYSATYKTSAVSVQGMYNLAEYAYSARGDWIYTGMFMTEQYYASMAAKRYSL